VTTPSIKQLRQEYARRNRRGSWWLRALAIMGGLAVLLILALYFVAPPIVRKQLEKRLSAELNRPVEIARVAIDPLRLAATIDGLQVREMGGGPFVSWGRLHMNLAASSLFGDEWVLDELALDGLTARVDVATDGTLNFADLLPTQPRAARPEQAKALRIGQFTVRTARIEYTDASRAQPFATEVGPISFVLRNFHTGGKNLAPGEFVATTEAGENISWRGVLAVAPLRSSGEFNLGKLVLKKYQPHLPSGLPVRVLDGQLDIAARYELVVVEKQIALRISEGTAQVRALSLTDSLGAEPVVTLGTINLAGLALDSDKRSLSLNRVEIVDGQVRAFRDAQGISLSRLFAASGAVAAPAAPAGGKMAPPFEARVAEFVTRGMTVSFEDRTVAQPVRQDVEQISFSVRNFSSTQLAAALPVEFSARLPLGGQITASGNLSLNPVKGRMSIDVERAPLATFSPYVESLADVRVARGTLSTKARVLIESIAGGAPVITAQGDATIGEFSATVASSGEALAGWRLLALRGFDFVTAPVMKTMIADVEWQEPVMAASLRADGTFNLSKLVRKSAADTKPAVRFPAPAAGAPPAADNTFMAVDRLTISGGALTFTDNSIEPAATLTLTQFAGTVSGLSSASLARADVDLKAQLNGAAPLAIAGQVNPLAAQPFSDLKIDLDGFDLAPLAPYVGKFSGQKFDRGSLTLDTKARLLQQRLDVTNTIVLTDFALGDSIPGQNSGLPIGLALRLLRDGEGRIVLDVPVQGSLSDPSFQIGRIVGRLISGLITKAATSPFSFIASAFGGGAAKGEELAFQEFSGGSTELEAVAMRKLDVLAKALRERPAIRLEVKGGYDEAVDAPFLRERELDLRVRTALWEEMRRSSPAGAEPVPAAQINITPEGEARMLAVFYREAFMPEPVAAPGEGVAQAEEAPQPSGGKKRRWYNLFGLFGRDDPAPPPQARPQAPPQARPLATQEAKPVAPLPPPRAMRLQLLDAVPIEAETLRELATARARKAREYLLAQGVPAERVSLSGEQAKGARVELQIK
jgi:hypothetical protein